ncbi:MAG: hypothetical protein KAI76_01480 [Alphaproteobacteria bacterium]|nr:hypothetical protein [Alphaproteobacteria bacterium]
MATIRFWLCIFATLAVITGFSSLAITKEAPPKKPQTTSSNTPAAVASVAEKKKDPCAAYSYEYYIVCKDRMRKIQSMLDARDQRNNSSKPKAPPAPKNTTPPIITDDSKSK